MASIKLTGDTSGVITVSAPAEAGTNTLTLPATTGTILDTNSALVSSKLTGALPAISGAALTGIASGGMTLLGTLTTTSGTSQSITIDLSAYNQIWATLNNVGHSGTSGSIEFAVNGNAVHSLGNNEGPTKGCWGMFKFDINQNTYTYAGGVAVAYTTGSGGTGADGPSPSGYYEAAIDFSVLTSAAFAFSMGGETFDTGSISVYGLK